MNSFLGHPTSAQLHEFIYDNLSQEDMGQVLDHLAECEGCLAEVDRLWQAVATPVAPSTPELDAHTAHRLRHQVMNRIHRTNLWGSIFTISTVGFSSVVMALIRPLSGRPARRHTHD